MQLSAILDEQDVEDEEQIRFIPPNGQSEWTSVSEWGYSDWSHWLGQHGWSALRIQQYLQVDRYKYGLGFRRKENEPYTWFYNPGPAAVPLHASRAKNVLYGGAAGGMKSHSTRWDAYRYCLFVPGYRSIIMRRTFEELKRNHLDKAVGECTILNNFFGGIDLMETVKTEHELRFKNGSKIIFGHCQNLGDEEKYLGDEYDDFRPDEEATFEKAQIIGVSGRLRSTKRLSNGARIIARKIGTSNPGGAYTLWLKSHYIDKNVTRAENPRYKPADYQFIPSRLYDNPYLMDPDGTFTEYENRLYAYSPERRRQLLNGDWNAITGQFFPEFKLGLHVGVLTIPEGCKIERWIDWGYSPNPGVCHWVACFPNGRLYVFAEWVFRETIAADVAKRIRDLTMTEVLPQTKGRISKSVGDPSMWATQGGTGESYAETFARFKVPMFKADNERVLGWGRYRHWLKPHPEGGAWIMYHPDCTYAIRTIPSLVHDKNDPDDVDTTGEDHAADADRYGVMARPTPTALYHSRTTVLPYSVKEMLNQVNDGAGGPRQFGQVS